MSGNAQGLPQRMTAFVDPKTGLVSDAWWRFLQALFNRTGGAEGSSSTDEIIQWNNMADVPVDTPPEASAWLAVAMDDALPPEPDQWAVALLTDAPSEAETAYLDLMADTPDDAATEPAAWQAATLMDVPTEPENDPALVALMVSD